MTIPAPQIADTDTVVLDLDGTLVDSVYVHVVAWRAAFRDVGVEVPGRRLHRLIGMGGDRLVAAATDDETEARHGDRLRELHPAHLDRLFEEITPTHGAAELLALLHRSDAEAVIASSSDGALTTRLLSVVPRGPDHVARVVTGSDAASSKPAGDLISLALDQSDPRNGVVIGDAPWDVHAAHDAGTRCLALLTGGFSESELRAAGADDVLDDPAAVVRRLELTGRLLWPVG